jgi:hypothetical protein
MSTEGQVEIIVNWMFAYSTTAGVLICIELRMLVPSNQEDFRQAKLRISVMRYYLRFPQRYNPEDNHLQVSWVRNPVRAVSVPRKINRNNVKTEVVCSNGNVGIITITPKKLFWVRFPTKVVSVTRKLWKIEKRLQDQTCLLWRDYIKEPELRKTLLISIPGKDGYRNSENKHDGTASRPKLFRRDYKNNGREI